MEKLLNRFLMEKRLAKIQKKLNRSIVFFLIFSLPVQRKIEKPRQRWKHIYEGFSPKLVRTARRRSRAAQKKKRFSKFNFRKKHNKIKKNVVNYVILQSKSS